MGTNSKLHLQFTDRHWRRSTRTARRTPTAATRRRGRSRGQPGTAGILVDYTGGTIGASFGQGTPRARAQEFLAQLEPLMPGISAK